MGHFIEEIPAQMQLGHHWYKGTADAIRQNLSLLLADKARQVLILPGDQIYKMDYRLMKRLHDDRRAGLTIATVRQPCAEARGQYGVLEVDADGRVRSFTEKPDAPRPLPGSRECLVSMGIYLFELDLLGASIGTEVNDFSRELIPALLASGAPVYAFDFTRDNAIEEYEYATHDGARYKARVPRAGDSAYWRDVGTLAAYWQANLDLVSLKPPFNLYSELWPIFITPQHFPPAKFVHENPDCVGRAVDSIVADGVIVSGATVRRSVLGPGIYVHRHSVIEGSVLMGGTMAAGVIDETQIGRHCRIRNAIIDKNVTLGTHTEIGFNRDADAQRGLTITEIAEGADYLVTVPKGTRL
jgi:glucose-1-phosphate adenylyltransferase